MASGHDMCFWNWTLIFLLPEMFSSHTSLMCCLALAVFKSGWWSHFFFTFLNLRYTELLFQIWYQMQLQNHFAVQSFIASNWSWFLSSDFQFTIFVYLVRINVSFKDIWKRLSVCLKKKWIFDVSEHSSLSTGNATKLNVSRNKVASESNHALSYVLDRVFHVNVVQERYQWRRYGWRNVFIVAFINLSQQTVLVHDNFKITWYGNM